MIVSTSTRSTSGLNLSFNGRSVRESPCESNFNVTPGGRPRRDRAFLFMPCQDRSCNEWLDIQSLAEFFFFFWKKALDLLCPCESKKYKASSVWAQTKVHRLPQLIMHPQHKSPPRVVPYTSPTVIRYDVSPTSVLLEFTHHPAQVQISPRTHSQWGISPTFTRGTPRAMLTVFPPPVPVPKTPPITSPRKKRKKDRGHRKSLHSVSLSRTNRTTGEYN